MKKANLLLVGALSLCLFGTADKAAFAQDVQLDSDIQSPSIELFKDEKNFANFNVTYSGDEKFAPYSGRTHNSNPYVDLSSDTGTAWITATMKNSEGAYRGGTNVQRGERKEFSAVNATTQNMYKLGLRKTNDTGGGSVTIKGTWAACQ